MVKLSPTSVKWNCGIVTQIDENLRLLIGNKCPGNEFNDCVEYHIVGPNVYCRDIGKVIVYHSDVYKAVDELGHIIPNMSSMPFVVFDLSDNENDVIKSAIHNHIPSMIFNIIQSKLKGMPGFQVKDGVIQSPDGYCSLPVS